LDDFAKILKSKRQLLEHVDLFICKYTTLSTKPREKHPPLETLRLNAANTALKSPQLEHIPLSGIITF
jgi:hypothetical protein